MEIEEKKNIAPVTDPVQEKDSIELEVAFARLKRIGKDKFQTDVTAVENISSKVKSSSQFFSLNFPDELHEYFIDIDEAPIYWILDSPLLYFLDEAVKGGENKEGTKGENKGENKGEPDQTKLIKDYYSKWVTTARVSEKKYFAQSLLKTISKEKNKTILSSIFAGVLYSYDVTLLNSVTAQTYYDQAETLLTELNTESTQKKEMAYILKVFSGFDFYKEKRFLEAALKFREALALKPEGVTAKFYLSLSEIILGDNAAGFDLICDVYDYDLNRITYAVNSNNFPLFQFFLKNPVFQNVLKVKEFAPICSQIDDYLQGKELGSVESLNRIRSKYETFKELHLNEYQEVQVKNSMTFFEKILKNYSSSPLNLFAASVAILWTRFNEILQVVFSTIRQRFLAEIQKQLQVYDITINDLNLMIEHLNKEIEDFKVKYKEKVKISIAHYEAHIKEQTEYLERRLVSHSEDKGDTPASTFKNSITYTMVLSALVVLIVGFASYSSNYSEESSGFGYILKAIIITGGKWGILTFIVGFFVTSVSTIYAVYEKSLEKQRIIKEIANLKQVKEKNIEHIKADAERNERISIKNYNERIETHRTRIKEIIEERKKHEEKLNKEIEEKIKEEAEKLIELIEKQ